MEADSDVKIVKIIGTKTEEATWRWKPTEQGHLKPTEQGHLKPTEQGCVSDTWGPRKMRRLVCSTGKQNRKRTEKRTEERTEERTEKREIWRYFRTNHKTYVGKRKEKVAGVFESDEDAGVSQQRQLQPKQVIVLDERRSQTVGGGKTFDTEIYDIDDGKIYNVDDSDSDISDSK
jgi:hypothetical protein